MTRICATLVLGLLAACGGGGGTDYGQHDLATLSDPCEGIAGLTGQAVLDQRTDHIQASLGYVTAAGSRVNPSALTIDLTWPAMPVATCYPAFTKTGQNPTGPRVAIDGLTMHFKTADGMFDETHPAKAWITTLSDHPQAPLVIAVASKGSLHGTWKPMPDYNVLGDTMSFTTGIATTGVGSGNVGLGTESQSDLEAAVFKSRAAIATW